jgi:hypothetical protein
VKAAVENRLARIWRSISSGVWAHLPIIIVFAIFFLASKVFLDSDDHRIGYSAGPWVKIFWGTLPVFVVGGGIIGLIWIVLTPSRDRPVRGALRWLTSRNWLEIVLLRVPFAFLLMSVVAHVYLNFKVNIPNFAPYSWDHTFAEIDRLLFLGNDPWVISHRIFSGLDATIFLDNIYLLWFIVLHLCMFSVAVLPMQNQTRLTFILAYGLNGIIGGTFLAIIMPAAGPVYMEQITGDPMFAPLMELLYQYSDLTEVKALGVQELLREGYTNPDVDPLGISAFPSVHVELAATFAFLGFAASRAIGWTLVLYTAATLIGSVHLGWHYAIDGIAGIALAIVVWRLSSRVTSWWLSRTEPEQTEAATKQPVAVN